MTDQEPSYEAYRPAPQPSPEAPPSAYAAPFPYGGAAPYGSASPYGLAQREHPQATLVLILGVVGIMGFSVCSPIAWVIGSRVRKEIAASGGAYRESGANTAGWVLGIVGTVLVAIAVLLGIAFIAVVVATAT